MSEVEERAVSLEFRGPEPGSLSWWQRVRLLSRWWPRRRRRVWVESVPVPEGGLAAALTEVFAQPGWGTDGLHISIADEETGWVVPLPSDSVRLPRGSIVSSAEFGGGYRLHLRIEHTGKEKP